MYLSIIIPVYNEQSLVLEVLEQLNKLILPQCVTKQEVIVVNDGSTDGTQKNIENYLKENPFFSLINLEQNRGKGYAVRQGMKAANGDVILIQDADLELSTSDIPEMIITMDTLKVDFVNGSRYLPGIIRPLYSYRRYLANKIFSYLTSIFVNVKITDMACGYKLFKKDLLTKIDLKENRFGFEAEIMIKALKINKTSIAEIPVKYFPRNEGEGKKFKTFDGFKILLKIFKYSFF